MKINKEEFKKYLVVNRMAKEEDNLISCKFRPKNENENFNFIDYTFMSKPTQSSQGSWGSSAILEDYLRWLREWKLNQVIDG